MAAKTGKITDKKSGETLEFNFTPPTLGQLADLVEIGERLNSAETEGVDAATIRELEAMLSALSSDYAVNGEKVERLSASWAMTLLNTLSEAEELVSPKAGSQATFGGKPSPRRATGRSRARKQ